MFWIIIIIIIAKIFLYCLINRIFLICSILSLKPSPNLISDLKMGNRSSREKLSKEDLDFLRANTSYDESTITEWYRGFRTDCPDGRLDPTSFMKIYSKCFPQGNAEEFCDHVFRTFDSDKNGFIDFKEFLLAIDVTSTGTPEQKLNWAFRYIVYLKTKQEITQQN